MTISKEKSTPSKSRDWDGRSKGGDWGLNFIISLVGRMSRKGTYFLLDVALPFYLPFNRKGFRATREFFEQRLGCPRVESFFKAWRTHRLFGQMMFDRFRFFKKGGDGFRIIRDGEDGILDRMKTGDGFIIAGSHIGSMEMAGYMLGLKDKPINALVFGGEVASLQSRRASALEERGIKLIPVSNDLSHLFAAKAALDEGEIVSMPCDRLLGSMKYIECDFFGERARFPMGCFILAAQLEKDMYALFNMKEGSDTYRVFVRPLKVDREGKTSRVVAAELAQEYSRELERMVRRYPLQWFNFYDFWKKDE